MHMCWLVGWVEAALPFQLSAIRKVIQCVRHVAGDIFLWDWELSSECCLWCLG